MLDAIKRETALIRGAFHGTMLRNEIFNFSQLGTFIERADNTARILDVKYYVLLPSISWVGSTLDNFQWESILRSVSAHRSYRWVYEADYKPTNIADYLILNGRMPRSLAFCYRFLAEHLKFLGDDYGERHACHGRSTGHQAMLRAGSIKDIFDAGLHEFLARFIRDNTARRRDRTGLPVQLTWRAHAAEDHPPDRIPLRRAGALCAAAAAAGAVSGPTQTVLSWALKIEGAREEVRFIDHFGNDNRLLSVEGERDFITVEATGEVETRDTAGVFGAHHGFAPLWLFSQRDAR